jgi:hypothetical protein
VYSTSLATSEVQLGRGEPGRLHRSAAVEIPPSGRTGTVGSLSCCSDGDVERAVDADQDCAHGRGAVGAAGGRWWAPPRRPARARFAGSCVAARPAIISDMTTMGLYKIMMIVPFQICERRAIS